MTEISYESIVFRIAELNNDTSQCCLNLNSALIDIRNENKMNEISFELYLLNVYSAPKAIYGLPSLA